MNSIDLVVEFLKVSVFPQVGDNISPGMGHDKTDRLVACLQVVEDRLGEDFKSRAVGRGDLECFRGLEDLDV